MGSIYKTRTGFTENPINGVMVLKEASIGAYFTCMNAYANYVTPQCPGGPRTNPYCAQAATADMAMRCNNFKADNAYIDIRLK